MKIVKVTYARTFPTGPYMNEKIGLEADIDGSVESVSASLAILKEMAEDFHKKSNPHLYQEQEKGFGDLPEHKKTQITFGPPLVIDRKADELKDLIDDCQTIEELKAWKEKHELVPVPVLQHYNVKLEVLKSKASSSGTKEV